MMDTLIEKVEALFKGEGFELHTDTKSRTTTFTGTKGHNTIFLQLAEGPLRKDQSAHAIVWPEIRQALPADAVIPILRLEEK